MATISSTSSGSGLDVNSIVTQLVAAERAPAEQRLTRQQNTIDTQISALGTLKGAMANLQTSLTAIKTVSAFQTRSAASSNENVFKASATSSAAAGSYSVEVTSLATAHKLSSHAFAAGSNAVVGTGTLTIAVGSQTFKLEIDASKSTLAGIRDAINGSVDNKGVQATIVQAADGARIVLTSRNTGAANALKLTTSGGDGGLSALIYDPGTTTNLVESQQAQDADLKVEGFTIHSASNTVTNAIDGITINLSTAAPGVINSLLVTNDIKTSKDRVNKFVTDFNNLATIIKQLRKYDPSTSTAGPLLGDSMLRSIESSIRSGVSSAVVGAAAGVDSLAAIGIKTSADGTLSVDDTKLSAAMSANFDAVGQLFGSSGGVAAKLYSSLDSYLGANASLTARTDGLQTRKRALSTEFDALDRRMADVEKRYRAQFSALDGLLTNLQTTSAFLTKQLG
jgi:flagellar hook-associated protein 2